MDEWQEEGIVSEPEEQEQEQEQDTEFTQGGGDPDMSNNFSAGLREMEALGLMDIGNLASWTASSSKQGFGLDQLRNESPLSFWQSDGPLPHHIDIQFSKRVSIERISIFSDVRYDESYTPFKLIIYAGTGLHDLQQVSTVEISEPTGWSYIKLHSLRQDGVLKTYLLRLTVATNHQNGKDTHIRAIKLYSPGKPAQLQLDDNEVGFTSVEMLSETVIR